MYREYTLIIKDISSEAEYWKDTPNQKFPFFDSWGDLWIGETECLREETVLEYRRFIAKLKDLYEENKTTKEERKFYWLCKKARKLMD